MTHLNTLLFLVNNTPTQSMPTQGPNPLDELADVTLGEAITWWPLAWGWWVLIALLLVACIFAALAMIKARRQSKAKRDALTALKRLDSAAPDYLKESHAILRKCVMAYWPQKEVASLHNTAWQTFLIKTAQNKQLKNASDLAEQIIEVERHLYQTSNKSQQQALNAAGQNAIYTWIDKALPPKDMEANHV